MTCPNHLQVTIVQSSDLQENEEEDKEKDEEKEEEGEMHLYMTRYREDKEHYEDSFLLHTPNW